MLGPRDDELPAIRPQRAAALFWLALAASVLVDGYLALPFSRAGWYLITNKLVLNGLAVVWLYADAKSRGWHADRIGLYVSIAAILIELVMPVYLVRSRGWRSALITVLRFCLYLLAFAVMLTAVGYIIGGPAIN